MILPRKLRIGELGQGECLLFGMDKWNEQVRTGAKCRILATMNECPASRLYGRAWPSTGEHGADYIG